MDKEFKHHSISIRVDTEFKVQIERAAVVQNRTMANFIRCAIMEHIKRLEGNQDES